MTGLDRLLGHGPSQRPRPRVTVELAIAVPAWTIRALAGIVTAFGVGAVTGAWVLAGLLAALVAVVAHIGVVGGLLVLTTAYLLNTEPSMLLCSMFVLVLHVVLIAARLTAPLPLTGAVEGRLLARVGLRFALIQVAAQALVVLAFVARAGVPPVPVLGVLALLAVGAAAIAGLRWIARQTS